MITTFGSSITAAYANGIPVDEIYANGEKVWPETQSGSYYIKWWPKDAQGTFTINSTQMNLETYSGYYSGPFPSKRYGGGGGPGGGGTTSYYIDSNAFANCSTIVMIETNIPVLEASAFLSCTGLKYVVLPKCTTIGSHGAATATTPDDNVFAGCTALVYVSAPKCKAIGPGGFRECTSLSAIYLPELSIIQGYTFRSCTNLISVSIPKVTRIQGGDIYPAFGWCHNLSELNLPVCSVVTSVFMYCSSFSTLYLGYSGVASIYIGSANPFALGHGSIYVPQSLVEDYKSQYPGYASRILPM